MLKKILLGVAVAVVLLLGVILAQPDEFKVARSATVNAAPEAVFAQINDFQKWSAWSPWAKLDPNMKEMFSGPPTGAGSVYDWTGNKDVGRGRMTILDSRPNETIRIRLEFIEPFPSTAITTFDLQPQGAATRVNWTMSGPNNFLSKAMCLFMGGMDKMIGPDFEKGLRQLKSTAEKPL